MIISWEISFMHKRVLNSFKVNCFEVRSAVVKLMLFFSFLHLECLLQNVFQKPDTFHRKLSSSDSLKTHFSTKRSAFLHHVFSAWSFLLDNGVQFKHCKIMMFTWSHKPGMSIIISGYCFFPTIQNFSTFSDTIQKEQIKNMWYATIRKATINPPQTKCNIAAHRTFYHLGKKRMYVAILR